MATRFANPQHRDPVRAGSNVALPDYDDEAGSDTVLDGTSSDDFPVDVEIDVEVERRLDVDLS